MTAGTDLEPVSEPLARGRKWVVVTATAMVILVVAGMGAATLIKSPAQRAADAAAPPPDVLTATVESRVLKETVVLRGTVETGQSVAVTAIAGSDGAARPVITRMPFHQGARIKAGAVVLEISGRPVVALQGRVPMYRDLRPGSSGKDVAQLQNALISLGYSTGYDTRGVFDAGTKAALESYYSTIGYSPLPAQQDGAASVAAAEDAVVQAERSVEDAPGGKDRRRAREDLGKAQRELVAVRAANGPMVPTGELLFLPSFPARVASTSVGLGDEVTGTAMTISSGNLIVRAYLQQAQKELVRPGMRVQLLSETRGRSYPARVESVADTLPTTQTVDGATGGQADSGPEGYLMEVKPATQMPAGMYGQDVRVTVEAASTEGRALVVPVTAISAGADARTTVVVVARNGNQRKVEVLTGTVGDGYVAVTPLAGERLHAGDEVLTGIPDNRDSAAGTDLGP